MTSRSDRAFAVGLALGVVALVAAGAAGALAFDDWLLLGSRRDVLDAEGVLDYLLRSHNDHLMALPVALHHAAAALAGLTSYGPWMVGVALVQGAVVVVVRALLLRVGVRPPLATAAALLLLVWGPATGALLWGLDAVFTASVGLFVVLLLLVADPAGGPRRAALGALVGVVAITIHTTAVLGLIVVVVLLAADRRWPAAALTATPLVAYGAWLLTYGRQDPVYLPAPGGPSDPANRAAPWPTDLRFGARMLGSPLEALLPWVPALLVLVVAVVVVWRLDARPGDPRRLLLGAPLVFAVAFVGLTAHGRAGWGLRLAAADRYASVLTVLALPCLALAVQHLADGVAHRRGARAGATTLVGLLIVVAAANVATFLEERRELHRAMHVMEDEVLAVAGHPDLDELDGSARVFPYLWDLTVDHVRRLVDQGLLPTDAELTPDKAIELRILLSPSSTSSTTPPLES